MSLNFIEQLTETSLSGVNISLVMVLVCVGSVLKHMIKNLDNNYIPVVLIILGAVLEICTNIPFNPNTDLLALLMQGMASGFLATMVHSKGKDIFGDMFGDKDIEKDIIKGISMDDIEDLGKD